MEVKRKGRPWKADLRLNVLLSLGLGNWSVGKLRADRERGAAAGNNSRAFYTVSLTAVKQLGGIMLIEGFVHTSLAQFPFFFPCNMPFLPCWESTQTVELCALALCMVSVIR